MGIWDVTLRYAWECGMLGMWDVRDVGCSGRGMLGCRIFVMCNIGDMGCLGCGMFRL